MKLGSKSFLYPIFLVFARNFKLAFGNSETFKSLRMLLSQKLPSYTGKREILKILRENARNFYLNDGINKIANFLFSNYHSNFASSSQLGIGTDILYSSYFAFIF
jgi:hypothetical protein